MNFCFLTQMQKSQPNTKHKTIQLKMQPGKLCQLLFDNCNLHNFHFSN